MQKITRKANVIHTNDQTEIAVADMDGGVVQGS